MNKKEWLFWSIFLFMMFLNLFLFFTEIQAVKDWRETKCQYITPINVTALLRNSSIRKNKPIP